MTIEQLRVLDQTADITSQLIAAGFLLLSPDENGPDSEIWYQKFQSGLPTKTGEAHVVVLILENVEHLVKTLEEQPFDSLRHCPFELAEMTSSSAARLARFAIGINKLDYDQALTRYEQVIRDQWPVPSGTGRMTISTCAMCFLASLRVSIEYLKYFQRKHNL